MPALGQRNTLTITRRDVYGVCLDAGEWGEVLLPGKQAGRTVGSGDTLEVFLYRDGNGDLVATTATPLVSVGECASLTVVDVTPIGAFLDWGLPKDLLLPLQEQASPVRTGQQVVARVYIDAATDRICASTRLHHFLPETSDALRPRQPVDLLIAARTELGYKAVIDGRCLGLLYADELSQPLRIGERMPGWVKAIRPDGRIDLSITMLDQASRAALEQQILDYLTAQGGSAAVSDKSPPEAIFRLFKTSKKNFKRALGNLYKSRLIALEENRTRLL